MFNESVTHIQNRVVPFCANSDRHCEKGKFSVQGMSQLNGFISAVTVKYISIPYSQQACSVIALHWMQEWKSETGSPNLIQQNMYASELISSFDNVTTFVRQLCTAKEGHQFRTI